MSYPTRVEHMTLLKNFFGGILNVLSYGSPPMANLDEDATSCTLGPNAGSWRGPVGRNGGQKSGPSNPHSIHQNLISTSIRWYRHSEHLISLVGWHDVMYLSLSLSLNMSL